MQPKTVEITGCQDGPHVLITGGVHGDEFEPMAAIRRLRGLLEPTRLRGRVTLVPVVNENAFWRGSRTAEDGLDLARVSPGDPAGSITQQTAHALSKLIRAADFYIDLHSGGQVMSVWPLAGYMLVPEPNVLDQQRRMAQAFNLPVIWGTDYRLEGRSLSVARDAGVPAIYAEYLGSGVCQAAGVQAFVSGCLQVLAMLDMIDHPAAPANVRIVVEDFRESAGHMQIRNPAPVAGFFEPQVELGQHIDAGQPLGTISDILGDHVVSVPARESGLVLVLRTFSRVQPGDALAVILESDAGG